MKLTDYKEIKRLTLLQYGEPGSGKSIRAASLAQFGPTYIFDLDNRIASVYHYFQQTNPEILKNLEYDTYTDVKAAYAKLNEIANSQTYQTVVLDSWTAWQHLIMQEIIKQNPSDKRPTIQFEQQKIQNPMLQDYGIFSNSQHDFIIKLVSLPCNVVVNCHVGYKQDELTGAIHKGVEATGKISTVLPKYFNEFHRCFVNNGQFMVQVRENLGWPAKTMLTEVPANGIIPADIKLLEKFIKGVENES